MRPIHGLCRTSLVGLFVSMLTAFPPSCGGDDGGNGLSIGRVPTLELLIADLPVAPGTVISVSSGFMLPGDEEARSGLTVINTGDGDLEISEITITAEPEGSFKLAVGSAHSPLRPGPYTIAPQGSDLSERTSLNAHLVVTRPPRGVAGTANLIIRSNSVNRGIPEPELVYPIVLQVAPPSLVVVPDTVDLGDVRPGDTRQGRFSLDNRGGDTLVVDRISLEGHDGYEVALGPHNWRTTPGAEVRSLDPVFELLPGRQATANVQYAARGPEDAAARLLLFSNDPLATQGTTVDIIANAGAPTAPVVTIEAPDGAAGQVLCKLLQEASDADALSYTWNWQVGDTEGFTTFSPTLGPDQVRDCDMVRCWTVASDGNHEIASNVAELILPFGADCDDSNLCTDDSCEELGGCSHINNTLPCLDGDRCNGDERCGDGQCKSGSPVECSDVSAPCLLHQCNPVTGKCDLPLQDGTECPDEDRCNGVETCQSGQCIGGSPTDCGANTDPCMANLCNPASGACDLPVPDGASCRDGDLCNGSEVCESGACVPGLPTDCSGVTSPCLQKVCNPSSGLCDLPVADGTSCRDSDLCNGSESCQDGVCSPGTPVDCSFVVQPCLQKTCNPLTGLCDLAMPDDTSCDDSDLCNGRETCRVGACNSGVPVDCETPATCRECNSETGACTLVTGDGLACDDADDCTSGDMCVAGNCVGTETCGVCRDGELTTDGEAASCDDGNNNTCDGCEVGQRRSALSYEISNFFSRPRPPAALFPPDQATLEFWFKTTHVNDATSNSIATIGGLYAGVGTFNSGTLISGQPGGTAMADRLDCRVSTEDTVLAVRSERPVNDGAWHHLACQFTNDATGLRVRAFFDGVEEGTLSLSQQNLSLEATAPEFGIAVDEDYRQTPGLIDEVRYSSVARYQGTFTPLRRFVTDCDTVALWHMDDADATTLLDSSGNGLELSGSGGQLVSDECYGGRF